MKWHVTEGKEEKKVALRGETEEREYFISTVSFTATLCHRKSHFYREFSLYSLPWVTQLVRGPSMILI